MEKPVIERFKKAIDYLVKEKIAATKKEIASKLGVSPSYFSEILNYRINLSADLLQRFLNSYPVNPAYIFSISDNLKAYTPTSKGASIMLKQGEKAHTPTPSQGVSSENVRPTSGKTVRPTVRPTDKSVHPTVHPTQYSGLPKVVTVDKKGVDNVVMVPVTARAGYLVGYGDPEFISDLPTYHIPKLYGGTFRAFEVEGHSMTPTITHGDIVFAEWVENFNDMTDDRVYVVVTKSDGILVKRVLNRVEQYGFLVCKSDAIINRRHYPNINIPPQDILEIWQAKMYLGADFSSPSDIFDRLNDLEAAIESLKQR
jgi:phage repressor protein C with HTH and peptisase S24 domain